MRHAIAAVSSRAAARRSIGRIGRADAEEHGCHEPRAYERRAHTNDDADSDEAQALQTTMRAERRRLAAEREADADVARVLLDEVRHHAVDADDRQHERRQRETCRSSTLR